MNLFIDWSNICDLNNIVLCCYPIPLDDLFQTFANFHPATMLRSLVNELPMFPDGIKVTCWIKMKSLTTEMSRVPEIEVGECIFQFLALIATFTEKMFSTNMCLVEMHHPWLSRHYTSNSMLYLSMRHRAVLLCHHCLSEEETLPWNIWE